MWNIDFESQLAESRSYLDRRKASDRTYTRYHPPTSLKVVRCEENAQGEFVPVSNESLDSVVSN